MKQVLLKSLLVLGAAFSLLLLFLGGLAIAEQSPLSSQKVTTTQAVVAPQPAVLPVELPPAQQEVITPTNFQRRRYLPLQSPPNPPPLPEWVSKLKDGVNPAAGAIDILKSATTELAPDGGRVGNGQRINYTIKITNSIEGSPPISMTVLDLVPRNLQGNLQLRDIRILQCDGGQCLTSTITSTIHYTQSGGITSTSIIIVETTGITWEINSLAEDEPHTLRFSALVFCQATNAKIKNTAFFFSETNGSSGESNEVESTVVSRVDQSGSAAISPGPTGCSTGVTTANRVSAGDFDADGDLDLAFGSATGLSVFRNNGQGRFSKFAQLNDIQTEDVLWADFDNDGKVELLGVGLWDNAPAYQIPTTDGDVFTYTYKGLNYLYRYENGSFQWLHRSDLPYSFATSDGVIRAAAGDYNGDGYLDLATANYWAGCTLLLHKNTQTTTLPTEAPFEADLDFSSEDLECIISSPPSFGDLVSSVAWGDYDNDGDQDLAVGFGHYFIDDNFAFAFPPFGIRVYPNTGGTIDNSSPIILPNSALNATLDLAWGDFNQDGRLDLAAAFLDGRVRVYINDQGGGFAQNRIVSSIVSPGGAVDWADFDMDGDLDLVVASSGLPPRIMRWDSSLDDFSQISTLESQSVVAGRVLGVRGFDSDNDSDMDLAVTNQNNVSVLYTLSAPPMQTQITPVSTVKSQSVAWGDVDNDGDLDLLLGAGIGTFNSQLHENSQGSLAPGIALNTTGFGPHHVAWGDFDGDSDQDAAIGIKDKFQVYRNVGGNLVLDGTTTSVSGLTAHSLAWADADDDGDLDLLTGNDGPELLFETEGDQLNQEPSWSSLEQDDTRSIAWADFNGDFFPDFAAGNYGGETRLYRNTQNNTFTLEESLPASRTTSIAWGDWDGDSKPELAMGNFNQPNRIYKRQADGEWVLAWTAEQTSPTTSVAWGDWNNDGDLDLAVGNQGQPVQVFENLRVGTGRADLAWRWTSANSPQTTQVAWGDVDNDGDLDLAVSQQGNSGQNGVYLNNYVTPSHFNLNFPDETAPLPNNPTYGVISRTNQAGAAYFFSSPGILANSPTITRVNIPFIVFDPDGTREEDPVADDPEGDDFIRPAATIPSFEFSLDGGGSWQTASGSLAASGEETSRLGRKYIFQWEAQADQAVSEQALFRITLANHMGSVERSPDTARPIQRAGLNQRGEIKAVSPPFRIRALTCVWPDNPEITIEQTPPYTPDVPLDFTATNEGSGSFVYGWDFGDSAQASGSEAVEHIYSFNGTYTVVMTVTGEACPYARSLVTTRTVIIGTGIPDILTYLPLVVKLGSSTAAADESTLPRFELEVRPGAPGQVTGLSGNFQPGSPTRLAWQPNPGQVLGYRVYRSPQRVSDFRRLVDLPATATTYTDTEAGCSLAYFVTAYNALGESLPSTTSYYTLPCQ